MLLSELKKGDRAYVLNSHQNNIFPAVVTDRDGDAIQVYNEAKDEHLWFWDDNGEADVPVTGDEPKSVLILPDDWRVSVLNARKLFKNHHTAVQRAQTEFRKDPSAERASVLLNVTERWVNFAKQADPFAVRAESIEEYKLLTKQI